MFPDNATLQGKTLQLSDTTNGNIQSSMMTYNEAASASNFMYLLMREDFHKLTPILKKKKERKRGIMPQKGPKTNTIMAPQW